ncbi:MAG: hypothetical protein LBT00_00350 [Spirochaetaceae bacterium]|nr:hypothetical protein [Spirochaetaceae bacterium]
MNTTYRWLCYRRNVLSQGSVLPLDAAVLGSNPDGTLPAGLLRSAMCRPLAMTAISRKPAPP